MKAAERRLVIRLLAEIQRSCWNEDADYLITDAAGRYLKVKATQPFLVTFWHDGPVDELRIVDFKARTHVRRVFQFGMEVQVIVGPHWGLFGPTL